MDIGKGTCGICTDNNSKNKEKGSARQNGRKDPVPLLSTANVFGTSLPMAEKRKRQDWDMHSPDSQELHGWTLILYALLRSRTKAELPVAP